MGYGFLIFDSKENAEKALSNLNGKSMPKTKNKTFKLNSASYSAGKVASMGNFPSNINLFKFYRK